MIKKFHKGQTLCLLIFILSFSKSIAQPTWIVDPTDLVLVCDAGVDYSSEINSWLSNHGNGTFTDGCGSPMGSNNFTGLSPDCAGADSILVKFIVTDMCGDTSSRSAYIAINDTSPPVFDFMPADMTMNCNQSPEIPGINIIDLCDPNPFLDFQVFNEQTNDGSCSDFTYQIKRIWIALDACGNTDTLRQTIFIQDVVVPSFIRPTDITINCSDDTSPANTGMVSNINDNCDQAVDITFEDFLNLEGCPNNYTIARLWKATDACGNESNTQEQTIVVRDMENPIFTQAAMNVNQECTSFADAAAAYENWLMTYGNAIATDNCTPVNMLNWFAAVPGSYQLNNPNSWPGTSPLGLSPIPCNQSNNGVLATSNVDFVVYDECNGISVSNATFNWVDQTAPVFDFCPSNIILSADNATCEGAVQLPLPLISETCNNDSIAASAFATEMITSDTPGDEDVIVNPTFLTITNIPTPPSIVNSDVNLIIDLNNVDGEAASEHFEIYLENGTLIGITAPTNMQCGTSSTSFVIAKNDFQLLALDGSLGIELRPNIPTNNPASFGVNDICSSTSSATATISFGVNNQPDVTVTYQVDGGNEIPLDFTNAPTLSLNKGIHTVVYKSSDCPGNTSQCSFTITVVDDTAPTITCPGNLTASLGPQDDCMTGVELSLPYPILISEDCSFNTQVQTLPTSTSQLLTFANDPNYLEYIAEPKTLTFSNVAANAVGLDVRFLVEVEGDIDEATEYFLIYGEDGSVLGATRVGLPYVTFVPGSCQTQIPKVIADINIPVASYNLWASDGQINFELIPNTDYVVPPPGTNSDGINPVCINFPNGTPDGQNDGQSKISMTLETQIADITYQITGATTFGPAPVPNPLGFGTHFFNLGESTVSYSTEDEEGNAANCSFTVTITDTISPMAICQATTIFINPSGLVDYTLDPSEINAGSSDNCGILNSTVSPNVFSCDQVGSTVEVTYLVEDENGNISSCMAMVAIEAESPSPDFSVSLCGNDTLFLFANPPTAQGGVIYTFNWSGPNGFTSNLENPIILNADPADAGSYNVSIQGITGCKSIGTVEVALNPDIAKPTISQPNITCEGEDLTLFVNISDGDSYSWIAPNFATVSTLTPFLQLNNVDLTLIGNWSVNVTRNGCVSPNADPVFLNIEATPSVFASNSGPVCEGGLLNLNANSIQNLNYQWTGPNGFSSSQQNPSFSAVPGLYTVNATSANSCVGTSNTIVTTLSRPVIDDVVVSAPPCLDGGTDVTIIPTVSGGDGNYDFVWIGPNSFSSIDSIAIIPNATAADNGAYRIVVTDGNSCLSEVVQVVLSQNDIPSTPIISGTESLCAGENLVVQSTSFSGNQVVYHWFTNGGEILTSIPSLQINNISDSTPVQLFVEVDGCPSSFSNILTIAVQPTPAQPTISGTTMVCEGGTILLETAEITNAVYLWSGPAGFTSNVRNPSISNATTNNSGDYQVQVSINGCVSEFSENFGVTVDVNPTAPTIATPNGVCLDYTGASIELMISAGTAVPGATYTWYELSTNNIIVPASTNLTASITDLSGFSPGQVEFYVVADLMGCGSMTSNSVAVSLYEIPNETAFAGDDFLLCDASSVELDAAVPGIGSGMWTQISGPADPLLSDLNSPNAVLSELESNQTYVFQWSLSNGACANYSSDEVEITYENIPQANPDVIVVPYATATDFNVKENDQIDISFFIDVIERPSFGTLIDDGVGNFSYQPIDSYAGIDEFVYKVCNQNCPDACTEATVSLEIGLNAECDVPTIFSPNNDGVNDSFIIPCFALDEFPNNTVSIFNQWGDEVHKGSPYRNSWIGTFNGEELPVGTYYYVIDFGTNKEPQAGFIILER